MPLSAFAINQCETWQSEYSTHPVQHGLKGSTRAECRRSKRKKGFRRENKITRHRHPKWLKMYHIEWMLLNRREIPRGMVVSHGCCYLNLKKKSRRKENKEWNKCFEVTHLDIMPQDDNLKHELCHEELRKFYNSNRAVKKSKRVKGTITVSDVARITKNDDLKCPNSNLECFLNLGNR